MSTTRKILLVVASVLAATIMVVVAGMLLRGKEANSQAEDQETVAPVTENETLTEENADYLEEQLMSSSKDEQELAFAPAMRDGGWDGSKLFPDNTAIEIDSSSFEYDEEGETSVLLTVMRDDEVLGTFRLYVVYHESEDRWLIHWATKVEDE